MNIEIQQLRELRGWAEANPVTRDDLFAMIEGRKAPIGDNESFVVNVYGMRVVFSIEDQPSGMVRHVSISKKEGSPQITDFARVEKHLGFEEAPVQLWSEDIGGRQALNVAQVMRS